MKLIDTAHPFYKPVWRRLAIVTCMVAWLAFEVFVSGNQFWMVLAGGALLYTGWTLLFAWPAKGK